MPLPPFEEAQVMQSEGKHVFPPFPQWRKRQRDDVQAKEEILAKPLRLDLIFQ